jgi:hypothetical protein
MLETETLAGRLLILLQFQVAIEGKIRRQGDAAARVGRGEGGLYESRKRRALGRIGG